MASPGSGAAQRLAQELRSLDLNAEVFLTDRKVAQQFKYAEAKGIQFVAQIGADGVSYKDITNGESRSGITAGQFVSWIQPKVKA